MPHIGITGIYLNWWAFSGPPLLAFVLLGSSCNKEPVGPENRRVTQRWFQPHQNGFPNARPVIAENVAYFASGGGQIVARHTSDGTARWTTQVGLTPHAASPEIGGANLVLSNGVVIVPVAFHTSALDAASGQEVWRYEAPADTIDRDLRRPGFLADVRIAADETTAYIPASGATVSAVDIRTGVPRWVWRVEQDLPFRSGAMGVRVSNNAVFATIWHRLTQLGGVSEAWLLALDRASGSELWRVVLPEQGSGIAIAGAPAVWGNLVFVTMLNGHLFAVDRNTRQVVWRTVSGAPPYGHPPTAVTTSAEVYADIVYFNGSDQKVHAFRAATGERVWESPVVGQFGDDMLVTERYIYATPGHELVILNRETGGLHARLRHPRNPVDYIFSTAVANGGSQIFATFNDGAWSFDEP